MEELAVALSSLCLAQAEVVPEGWGLSLGIVIALIGEALAIVFVVRILARGGSTAATLNWVLVILAAPYLGLFLYYLLPRRIHMRRLRRRQNRLSWISSSLAEVSRHEDDTGDETRPAAAEDDPLIALLRSFDPHNVAGGNRLTLIESGADFFSHAAECVRNARDFVHLETYILRPDRVGLRLLELLAEVAARGIEVRLLYDSLGSWSLKQAHLRALLDAGGKAEAYLPIFWRRRPFTLNLRNHRKLLVVDGETAFLGGRNVGDEYANDHFGETGKWLDTMVKVEGPGVTRLHRVFVEDWCNAAEEDLASERYFPVVKPVGDDRIGIIASGPDTEIDTLSWVLFQLFVGARCTIDISSPYLIPDRIISTALQVASTRGVRVRVHTNGRGVAQGILHRAQRSYYHDLLAAGVEINESRTDYNHSKLILIDDDRLLVGSPNLDVRSEMLNFEIAVVTVGSPISEAARDMFERRLQGTVRVRAGDLTERWWDPVVNGVCRLLSPLL